MRGLRNRTRRSGGRSECVLLFLVLVAGCVLPVSAQNDNRIEAIRRLSIQVNEQIDESERVEESNGVYCNELVVNKGNRSWPAVGIYRTVVKFYYTFGDREKNPYPNRLMKITVTTNRSDRREYAEYLFNPAEQLIFYYEKDGESAASERRYYFASERLIRRTLGERSVSTKSREAVETVARTLASRNNLKQVFLKSLDN